MLLLLGATGVEAQTISGSLGFCSMGHTILNGTPAGGIWTSGDASVATVDSFSGLVIGPSLGTAVISYTQGGNTATAVVTVYPAPPISIPGPNSTCVGGDILLSTPQTGGLWSCGLSATLASYGPGSAYLTGVTTGIVTVTYTLGSGSTCSVTKDVTVNSVPAAITGSSALCLDATQTMSHGISGGTWSSSNTSIAAVHSATGNVSGVSAGTALISYNTSPGCYAIKNVTVTPLPAVVTSTTGFQVCAGGSISLSSAPSGGTWSSSSPATASISSAGSVYGLVTGTSAVSYTLSTGCYRTVVVSVNPLPAAITGPGTTCVYSSVTFSSSTPGGSWSSAMPSIAYAGSATGLITGLASGFATVHYTLPTGCSVNKHISVSPLPSAIIGPSNVCAGSIVTLASATSGGSWSVSGSGVASIDAATGVVSGVGPGAATISYTLPTSCATTRVMTVNATPGVIMGNVPLCPGANITLTNALEGGIWMSGGTSIATVSGAGGSAIVTGVAAGTATISYITAGGCSVTGVVTVMPLPNAGVISGPGAVCAGASITLTSTSPGGLWASGDLAIASAGAGGGVAGVSAGVSPISYSVTNSCGTATTTTNVTVTAMPASIIGTASFCQGTSSLFSNSVPGGSWSSTLSAVATMGSYTGVASGITPGTATIIYSIAPAGCTASRIITVNPSPAPIGGGGSVCVGNVLPLVDTVWGGVWTSSNPAIAVVFSMGGSTGVLSGLAPGVVTVTYSIGSCVATTSVTVNAEPTVSVTATPNACGGSTILSASGPSVTYEWSPVAGLSCSTCAVTTASPLAGPVFSITGTDINGCTKTETIVVATDRIFGHVLYTGTPPVNPRATVILIGYDPADSSIVSMDTTLTCLDGAEQYYEFPARPVGRYAVVAQQETGTPGISGYVPTYAGNQAHWFNSSAIAHTVGAADGYDVSMIFGNVPSGPGYIAGYLYAGDGSGNGVVTAGVMVLLKDASGQVVTYTYTNSAGIYTFSGLALGTYTIHPEAFGYYTTTSSVTLTATGVFQLDVTFKKDTANKTIYPFTPIGVRHVSILDGEVRIYPNPAHKVLNIASGKQELNGATLSVADVAGRLAMTQHIDVPASGDARVDVSNLVPGMYILTITSADGVYTAKLVVE